MKTIAFRLLPVLLSILLTLGLCGCRSARTDTPAQDSVATLAAVGDIYLTTPMLLDARTGSSYDFSTLFAGVTPTLSAADLTIGNLEGTFADSPYGPNEGSYPDALAAALNTASFDMLQTANSFSIYNGLSSLMRTRSVLQEQSIIPLGTYSSSKERSQEQAIALEINGIRFVFVAFTKGLNGMSIPEGSEYCVNLLYQDYDSTYSRLDYDAIDSVLAAAYRLKPDVIVAALHWGSENVSEISASQEELAAYLFRKDVDLILGSHSHLAGQIETRQITTDQGREKTVAVAYSLGDFCAAGDGALASPSLVLQVEFTRSAESGKTSITDVSYTAIATVDLGVAASPRFSVLCLDEAIALYENNYYDKVTPEVYDALLSARERLLEQLSTPESDS